MQYIAPTPAPVVRSGIGPWALASIVVGVGVGPVMQRRLAGIAEEADRSAGVHQHEMPVGIEPGEGRVDAPVVNVGTRDHVAAEIQRVQGIFNSTSNYILTQMAAGQSYDDALAETQRRGIAETNPRLDVEGWDTANKLTIVANAVLGFDCTVRDVQQVEGISESRQQENDGNEGVVKLLGVAERRADGGYDLSVRPVALSPDHKLAQVSGWQMGVLFESDLFEEVFIAIDERGPTGTAAAMLRDVVNLYRDR